MTKGNIVRWHGELYIVAKVETEWKKGQMIPISCELLSGNCANSTAHPSRDWPDNPTKRIDSVEVLANNLTDFLHDLMDNAIDQMIGK